MLEHLATGTPLPPAVPVQRAATAIDVEGDAGARGFRGLSTFDERGGRWTQDRDEARAILVGLLAEKRLLVAHNAEYDTAAGLWQLGIDAKVVSYNGRYHHTVIPAGADHVAGELWCTGNLSAYMRLARIGEAMGMPKYSTPQSLLGVEADRWEWRCDRHGVGECVECYAIRDACIAFTYFESLREFLSGWGVRCKPTLGSTAVALWRALDNPGDVHIRSRRVAELARAAYHGGRTEAYALGTVTPVYTADISMAYPHAMTTTPMPDMDTVTWREGRACDEEVLRFEGVSECSVVIPPMHVPPLPVVSEGRLLFPVGPCSGVWTHLELRAAFDRGVILERITRSAYSPRTVWPFTYFVETLRRRRADFERAGDPRKVVAKVLANSLYGRLGLSTDQQLESMWPVPDRTPSADLVGLELLVLGRREFARRVTPLRKLAVTANVLWAAQITAAVRVRLLQHMEAQGEELLYVDTDSVFSRSPVAGTGKGFGELVDQGRWESGLFIGPKLYRLEDSIRGELARAKGIPREVAAEYLRHGEATFSQPWRVTDAVRSGKTPGAWRPVTKRRHLGASKRLPVLPELVTSESAWSPTVPPVLGDLAAEPPPENL